MVAKPNHNELYHRALSAVVLAAIAVSALWLGDWAFTGLVIVMASLMCWEWGRAVRGAPCDRALAVHVLTAAVGCWALSVAQAQLFAAALAVGIAAVYVVGRRGSAIMSAVGVPYIAIPAATLVWMRGEIANGFAAVLFLFAVIWVHDTFAMLVGKSVGGPRLWPLLSPNKTWSGVAGGLSAAAVAGAAFAALLPRTDPLLLAASGLILGFAGLLGDLLESAFKRKYGLKNASGLIPGHGGVLDRLDGVALAAVAAALMALCINPQQPATAILYWQ